MVDILMKMSSINHKFEFVYMNSSERLNNFLFAKYLKWNSLVSDDKAKEKGKVT